MKTTLLVVGKTTNKNIDTCIKDYSDRIIHYMPFDIVVIPELKQTKSLSESQQKEMEGQLILRKVLSSDYLVLLDERGKEMSSKNFAKWIEACQMKRQNLIFVIGGPYGFSEKVYERCNYKISLSQMTFSHEMVRMIFAEQLYRACTIMRGEPYHHD